MRPILVAVLAAGPLAIPAAASAQGTFFTMDCSGDRFPACGWSRYRNLLGEFYGERWIDELHPDGGPTGAWAAELRVIPSPAGAPGVQFGWGWDARIEASDPPDGARRYYRYRLFAPEDNNGACHYEDELYDQCVDKLMFIGQGCETGDCRVIHNIKIRSTGEMQFSMAIDGGEHNMEIDRPDATGKWWDVQIEVAGSTGPGAGDGGWKVWLDNNDYDAPDGERGPIQLDNVEHGYVGLGNYANASAAPNGIYHFLIGAWEAGTGFDPAWHLGAAPGDPPDSDPPRPGDDGDGGDGDEGGDGGPGGCQIGGTGPGGAAGAALIALLVRACRRRRLTGARR